jgi:hypothetical protein
MSLCLSGELWQVGWIVPHVPHHLLLQLEPEIKEQVMNALVIGDDTRGAWLNERDYARVKVVLEPSSESQSCQSYYLESEESFVDEDEPLEATVARIASCADSEYQNNIQRAPSSGFHNLTLGTDSIQRVQKIRAQRAIEKARLEFGLKQTLKNEMNDNQLQELHNEETEPKALTKSKKIRKERARQRIEELRHHNIDRAVKPRSMKKHSRRKDFSHCARSQNMALIASLIQY